MGWNGNAEIQMNAGIRGIAIIWFTCPRCGERQSTAINLDYPDQTYEFGCSNKLCGGRDTFAAFFRTEIGGNYRDLISTPLNT